MSVQFHTASAQEHDSVTQSMLVSLFQDCYFVIWQGCPLFNIGTCHSKPSYISVKVQVNVKLSFYMPLRRMEGEEL
jgi:hypothetical protein